MHFTDPKVGVGALVVVAGRLLLVRRGMHPEVGRWALPAGFLDAGEDPRATVAREVAEETGLAVEVGEVVDVYGGSTVFLVFRARPTGGTLRAGDDASDVGWFGRDDLPDIAFASTREAVDRWLS